MLLLTSLTRGVWVPGIGRSLACTETIDRADAILVDNFEENYLLFERAAELQKAGMGPRVLVPTDMSSDSGRPSVVTSGIVELMARVAWLQAWETIPVREIEPISLNAAYQIREVLTKERIRSVVVVSPGFRSRRSSLIYRSVFGQAGVAVSCAPVFGQKSPETWTTTWHGIQEVSEQFLKLQYYRFYVLPVQNRKLSAKSGVRASND
jgi:hypothetical protein